MRLLQQWLYILCLLLAACLRPTSGPTLTTADGKTIRWSSLINHVPTAVYFWQTDCVPCQEDLALLEAIAQKQSDLAILAVTVEPSPSTLTEHRPNEEYHFSMLSDVTGALQQQYSIITLPTTLFFSAGGSPVRRLEGPLDASTLLQYFTGISDIKQANTLPHSLRIEPSFSSSAIMISEMPASQETWCGMPHQSQLNHLVPLGDIASNTGSKGPPAIIEPHFFNISEAVGLQGDDQGILVQGVDSVRFYPLRTLALHQVVNDVIDEIPIVILHSEPGSTSVVFRREAIAGAYESSQCQYSGSPLLRDRQTGSLWDQFSGQAIVGPLTGTSLHFVHSAVVSFRQVQAMFPNATVLSANPSFFLAYTSTGNSAADAPRTENQNTRPTLPGPPASDAITVIGVVVNGIARAYAKTEIETTTEINDTPGGVAIRLMYDNLTGDIGLTRLADGSPVAFVQTQWQTWIRRYPQSEIYQGNFNQSALPSHQKTTP